MANQSATTEEFASIEDYLRALRHRKWLILALAVVGVLAATFMADRRSPVYEAEARVLLGPSPAGSTDGRLVQPNLERERAVLASEGTATAAVAVLSEEIREQTIGDRNPSLLLRDLSVTYRPDSDVLQVTYSSESAEAAAAVANAFAAEYSAVREQASIDFYASQIELVNDALVVVESQISEGEAGIVAAVARRSAADAALDTAGVAEANREIAIIDDALSQSRVRQRALQIEQFDLEQQVSVRPEAAAVLRPASEPVRPEGLTSRTLSLAGLLVGLFAGVAAAFLLDRLDKRIRGESDIEQAIGARVLATIPKFSFRRPKGSDAIVAFSDSRSPLVYRAREEYRRLRSSLLFLGRASDRTQVVAFTSTGPGEGKSTTVANLGATMAGSGKRTALVSADLRRPTIESIVGIEAGLPGLTDWLGGRREDVDLVQPTSIPGLFVVPGGSPSYNPAELLGSDRMTSLVEELRRVFDFVIVDTPPVLAAADTLVLAGHTDGIVLVVDSRHTDSDALRRVRTQLDQVGANVIGAVLNRRGSSLARFFPRRTDAYTYRRAEDPNDGDDQPVDVSVAPASDREAISTTQN